MKQESGTCAVIGSVELSVTRKPIKNIYIYVKPPDGRVEVSAPVGMSRAALESFVRSKLAWIRRQQEKLKDRRPPEPRAYVTGETLLIWGRPYRLRVEHGGRGNSLVTDGDTAVLTVRGSSTPQQRERFVKEWYRSILMAEIARLLPKWESVTGLHPSGWQTKDMTTRWGTCNLKTRKIWLNLQLAKKPPECLEYVILHELAHLRVKDHGKRFEALLNRYMPDWRAVRGRLNGGGVPV